MKKDVITSQAEKQAEAWAIWTECLPPDTRDKMRQAELPPIPLTLPTIVKSDDDEDDAYFKLRLRFPGNTQKSLDAIKATDAPVVGAPAPEHARFCLMESEDGEWPVVRAFKNSAGLAARLGELEGRDMVAFAYFGIPLIFTKGPQRYMVLPDARHAIQIPMYVGGPCKIVDVAVLVDAEPQIDGFIGRRELAEAVSVREPVPVTQRARHRDDEEEDEDQESGDRDA